MNNEEKILELLGQVIEEQKSLRNELTQFRTEVNDRFDTLESSLKFAWEDIDRVELRIKQHEKEYHEAV